MKNNLKGGRFGFEDVAGPLQGGDLLLQLSQRVLPSGHPQRQLGVLLLHLVVTVRLLFQLVIGFRQLQFNSKIIHISFSSVIHSSVINSYKQL